MGQLHQLGAILFIQFTHQVPAKMWRIFFQLCVLCDPPDWIAAKIVIFLLKYNKRKHCSYAMNNAQKRKHNTFATH